MGLWLGRLPYSEWQNTITLRRLDAAVLSVK